MKLSVGLVIASHAIPRRFPLHLYPSLHHTKKFLKNGNSGPSKQSLVAISDNVNKPVFVCILSAILCFGHLPDILTYRGNGIAEAAGLIQMPPAKLSNRYYLVRSGESVYENKGFINTNPVTKTSVDSGLSEEGQKQMVKAALELEAIGVCRGSCWIWPSITQRAYQSAEIIASINVVDHSRIVPEYSFLDARGLGVYEGRSLKDINEIHAADLISSNFRPPPFTDGTPNESVVDVFVRMTQLMSILETQYSGENVIIISPDSDNLTILLAGLTGIDLRRHSELSFSPGEIRFFDIRAIPAPKKHVSGLFKCLKPPNCS